MASRKCNSPSALAAEVHSLRQKLSQDETEESWDSIAKAISHLTLLCTNGGCDFAPEMVASIKSLGRPLSSAMNSERSRLSGPAIELVGALAAGLGSSFEPLLHVFVPTLLNLFARTNKVFTTRAKTCMLAVIEHTNLPAILSYLVDSLGRNKSPAPRLATTECVLACLNCFNPPDLEKESRARLVEDVIRATARDASADVRKASKRIFEAYRTLMPNRVESFVAPLTPVIKKYLDVQGTRPPNLASSHGLLTAGKDPVKLQTHPQGRLEQSKGGSRSASSTQAPVAQSLKNGASKQARHRSDTVGQNAVLAKAPGGPVHHPLAPQRGATAGAGPSRPPSVLLNDATTSSKPKTVQRPPPRETTSRPPISGPPARTLSRQESKCPVPTPRGPLRPDAQNSGANELNKEADGKTRVGGGARRVPILPPSSTRDAEESESPSKPSRPVSRNERPAAKNHARANTIGKPPLANLGGIGDTTSKGSESAPPSTKPSTQADSSRKTAGTGVAQTGTRNRGVSNPTVSQISRRNALASDRKLEGQKQPNKPAWGRLASKAITKPLVIENKSVGVTKKTVVGRAKLPAKTPEDIAEAMIPLPPSPHLTPTAVRLPPSPPKADVDEHDTEAEEGATHSAPAVELPMACSPSNDHVEPGSPLRLPFPSTLSESPTKTPITALLSSIQRGFLFTPSSPLSPPQSYLPIPQMQFGNDINSPCNEQAAEGLDFTDASACMESCHNTDATRILSDLQPSGDDVRRQALGDVAVN
ncbi:hypothetical protein BV22DRAFT_1127597 [Leucogyrophana mollusca]|uniref:Uncharacterized protein n=1 Tax=Leucogyrophana mollusca TaxID=85980 RepID=A0ACB8BMH6_9AGAM|nr:hypothetical protein BV22DRAFT_1127597 [Leucogyrophana mollusca]